MAHSNKLPLFIVNHVFMPPQLPQEDDLNEHDEQVLCQNVYDIAQEFGKELPANEHPLWDIISKFLQQFSISRHELVLSREAVIPSLQNMQSGDVLAFLIRAQNAGVIIRKEVDTVVFELFEVAPPNEVVMSAKGRLICSFPGPAVQVPTEVFQDPAFQAELARFLVAMDEDRLDSAPTTTKAKSEVTEVRDTEDPRYITQLLTEILRGMGDAADVPRITKRIADDILWSDAYRPWRRSATWLVLRVALQTTLVRKSGGHERYKEFIVFLHARILMLGLESDLPSHLIDCMRKKTARRLNKLGSTAPLFLVRFVDKSMRQTECLLQKRWVLEEVTQATSLRSTWAPKTLDVVADTTLTLYNSKAYLKRSLERITPRKSTQSFNPNHSSRIPDADNFARSNINRLKMAFKSDDRLIALADFERAVLTDLTCWAAQNLHSKEGGETIATSMEIYSDAASGLYSSDPELLSVMLLTLFKLWVELDRMAVAECPLLEQFSPEIPCERLHSLLLRTSESIGALARVEKYLETRHSKAVSGQSVFACSANRSSFAVQYFDQDRDLQRLRAEIEESAEKQRLEKLDELRKLQTSYRKLQKEADQLEHIHIKVWYLQHGDTSNCRKCRLNEEAREMTIKVHEWPLPMALLEAKIVVFELSPPPLFNIWRRITYMLLRDICTPEPYTLPEHTPQKHLHDYSALAPYFSQGGQIPQISLASITKSFKRSHYRHLKVSCATEGTLCVNHGLRWRLFYNPNDEWVTPQVANCTVNEHCTLRLPPGNYQNLQYAVSQTSHTSNEIMANQIECPQGLTLHEFIAFTRIRSGPRLQWLSILSEFRSSSLSFQEAAIYALLRQAAWQMGPLMKNGQREWHTDLTDPEFGKALLAEAWHLLQRLQANWCNLSGIRVISAVTSRLLASATDNSVMTKGFELMREARSVTYGWLREVVSKVRDIEDETHMKEHQKQVCEIAATCRSTYDIDTDKREGLLFSADDVMIFTLCAILVNRNSPPNIPQADIILRNLLHRDLRLSHQMEPLISRLIAQSGDGLDSAIRQVWESYHSSSEWKHCPSPNNRWITTCTTEEDTQETQAVEFDLLSGQLLIDGKPLGRLPKNITTHPTYCRIFGQRILDVIPANMSGMDFKASTQVGIDSRNPMSGYQVFFGLRDTESENDPGQLVIRTQRGAEILELIPHDTFEGDLPAILFKEKTHWLNLTTIKGEIEIRDLKTRWISSACNWRIRLFRDEGSTMRMKLGNESLRLIDPRSATMSMISAQLQPLEHHEYLIVSYSSTSTKLCAYLPRFRLEFFLNNASEPQLESQNMPGMVVDASQSAGTMIGLRCQLILRQKDSPGPSPRQIIIPYIQDSHFIISPSIHHNKTSLSIEDRDTVRYLTYSINPTLGRLEGDGSMLSKLYRIYLHAITSHCLPDPLTGRTGTEEALQELRSAGMLSFQKLEEEECRMLQRICELTPTRTFYPVHLKVMQTVVWSGHAISPLAQHADFYTLSNTIRTYSKTLGMFSHPEHGTTHGNPRPTSGHLLDRAARRNATLYRDQASGPIPSTSHQHDTVYNSRGDSVYSKEADEGIVFNISAMVFNWESRLSTETNLYHTLTQRGSISGITEEISLAYSRVWLKRDISKYFLSACNTCRTSSREENQYQITFSLCAWAYTSVDIRPLIPTILAFATVPRLRDFGPPKHPSYDLSAGLEATETKISDKIISECMPRFDESAESNSDQHEMNQRISTFNRRRSSEARELTRILRRQWLRREPVNLDLRDWLFDVHQVEEEARAVFGTWLRNKDLFDYIQDVQPILADVWSSIPTRPTTLYTFCPSISELCSAFNLLLLDQLFATREAPDISPPPTPLRYQEQLSLLQQVQTLATATVDTYTTAFRQLNPGFRSAGISFRVTLEANTRNMDKLRQLLHEFRESTFLPRQDGKLASIQREYADDLETSLQSLGTDVDATHQQEPFQPQMSGIVRVYYNESKEHLQTSYQFIRESLLPSTKADQVLLAAGLWPCLTKKALLATLSFGSHVLLTSSWRKTLNSFARAILMFQRACRLQKYFHENKVEEFSGELKNIGVEVEGNDDEQSSIRLLIQIDGNFLARPIQIDFMKEMMDPSSTSNTALQLNMGEGKSSVIVPMVAAALSDGNKLVRVVALKQLAPSMFQLLVRRLGGLANRRIFYMPFSRSPQLSLTQAQQVQELFSTCMQVRGVLLVQPEHILSFKLMGLDRRFHLAPSSEPTSSDVVNCLLKSQRWLFENSRDILDESDEILHVRYQLTYTVGQQQSLQGSPDRWTIVQQTLTLVRKHAKIVQDAFRDGIEVLDTSSGSYPHIRILQDKAGAELIRLVAEDVSRGELEQCSFNLFPADLRPLALSYITKIDLTSKDVHLLEDYCRMSGFWNTLLILRGLLAHGILHFVLKEKRWRVDYGLDSDRSMLAVPYRAKDIPSSRAEFSHPDVAIMLTCLTYYWKGLSKSQLKQSFEILFRLDDPTLEYGKWIRQGEPNDIHIPEELQHSSAINPHDPDQCVELHAIFQYNKAAIDFFLSQIVFPREAKEFPKKMTTSGWDLAERKRHVTTGFSGTKDGSYLLPTSIDQTDPLSQSSTNAKVLTYLLQPENGHYQRIDQRNQEDMEQSFLRLLSKKKPAIRVLLDVGAQILKLSNDNVAAMWLDSNQDHDEILAIVFFRIDDKPYVRTRNGEIEPLVSSPFLQQLDKCLLYLDDAHTRGTDFKLPVGTRAAVTLGPKVTKDRLLQGCMRMRKLGFGHSVMFFAPLEVDQRIRAAAGLQENTPIEVRHILLWTMMESCMEVVHRVPQWAQQGMDYQQREKAWVEFNKSPYTSIKRLESAWVRDEARSLEDMYAFQASPPETHLHGLLQYREIAIRYLKWARASISDLGIEEEEEREVLAEVEIERQVERPPKAIALTPHVHSDVRVLVQEGVYKADSDAFVHMFRPFKSSWFEKHDGLSQHLVSTQEPEPTSSVSVAQLTGGPSFEEQSWSSQYLVATKDFSSTVRSSHYDASNDYLRPVNWVLSVAQSTGTIFIVISPHEVNELLPDIRRSKKVHLHQYAPRVAQAMKSFENLAFHCIPPLRKPWVGPDLSITTRLNLWSGQLYLENEEAYQYLCNFLGLYTWQPSEDDVIQPDGFVKPKHRRDIRLSACSFVDSSVPYLKSLFISRRKGMDYIPTHMGKILRGRLLTPEDFM